MKIKTRLTANVTLGIHRTHQEYIDALEADNRFKVSPLGHETLCKISLSPSRRLVKLAIRTPQELGFTVVARVGHVLPRAAEFGLVRCPAEVGPALRLALTDQELGGRLTVLVDPITLSDHSPKTFILSRDDGRPWLDAGFAYQSDTLNPDAKLVFVDTRR